MGIRIAADVPYRTRIVVRRPAKPAHFNGTALVEWQNVTAGYDLDALWNYEHIMREGYAWIGVSAQRVGVDQLRSWSPTRYGDLDVTGGNTFPRGDRVLPFTAEPVLVNVRRDLRTDQDARHSDAPARHSR